MQRMTYEDLAFRLDELLEDPTLINRLPKMKDLILDLFEMNIENGVPGEGGEDPPDVPLNFPFDTLLANVYMPDEFSDLVYAMAGNTLGFEFALTYTGMGFYSFTAPVAFNLAAWCIPGGFEGSSGIGCKNYVYDILGNLKGTYMITLEGLADNSVTAINLYVWDSDGLPCSLWFAFGTLKLTFPIICFIYDRG